MPLPHRLQRQGNDFQEGVPLSGSMEMKLHLTFALLCVARELAKTSSPWGRGVVLSFSKAFGVIPPAPTHPILVLPRTAVGHVAFS